MSIESKQNPFGDLTRKARWEARLGRWQDQLLRFARPSRIEINRPGGPNLLLLGIDTLRSDHLGLGGCSSPTSPNLDRLAAGGTIFGDVTAPAPWTLPSFSSALTGVMPGLHGGYLSGAVRNMDHQPPGTLDPKIPTLATRLRKKGYRTAAFYSNQFFAFGLAESFDHHSYHNLPAEDLARLALEWIRRNADRPFFCFVLFNDPHEPTTPSRTDLAPFLTRAAAAGASTDSQSLRAYARWGEPPKPHLGQAKPGTAEMRAAMALKLAIYDATIHSVDRTIGHVQKQLEEWALDSKTLVSVFADHGEEFADHVDQARQWDHDPREVRGIGHGHTHFQELLHVPWVSWGAGVPAGVRRRDPVSLCDLAPTLLDWLGAGEPLDDAASDEIEAALKGRSVAHEPTVDSSSSERLLLAEAIAYGPDLVALRKGEWKFIGFRSGEALALYRLAGDPGERNNLIEEHPEQVAEFQELLARWRATGQGAGSVSSTNDDAPQDGAPKSWNDLDDTVRQRLKDLGYSD